MLYLSRCTAELYRTSSVRHCFVCRPTSVFSASCTCMSVFGAVRRCARITVHNDAWPSCCIRQAYSPSRYLTPLFSPLQRAIFRRAFRGDTSQSRYRVPRGLVATAWGPHPFQVYKRMRRCISGASFGIKQVGIFCCRTLCHNQQTVHKSTGIINTWWLQMSLSMRLGRESFSAFNWCPWTALENWASIIPLSQLLRVAPGLRTRSSPLAMYNILMEVAMCSNGTQSNIRRTYCCVRSPPPPFFW